MGTAKVSEADIGRAFYGAPAPAKARRAEGRQYMESSGGDGHVLMLSDDKSKQVTQVMIAKAQTQGSDIQILANRGAGK